MGERRRHPLPARLILSPQSSPAHLCLSLSHTHVHGASSPEKPRGPEREHLPRGSLALPVGFYLIGMVSQIDLHQHRWFL